MTEKYRGKYRNDTVRLKNWDYGWNAPYFVTICTKNREHYFGEIADGKMVLNQIGDIVKKEWLKTFEMRPDMNLTLGEFVVMPNHFHGIIVIGENQYNNRVDSGRSAMHCAPIGTTTSSNTDEPKNQFGPQSKNLASIIRGFKIGVTKNARLIHPDFAWQSRYYDHIIRNDDSFQRISNYIKNNPTNWKEDEWF